jgi:hypothetical protein
MEDAQGNIELVVFPRAWDQYAHLVTIDKVLLVEGKVDAESGDPKLLVDRITPVDNPPEPVAVYETGRSSAQPGSQPESPAGRRTAPAAVPAAVEEDPFSDVPPPPTPDDWDLLPPPVDFPDTEAWPVSPDMPALPAAPAASRPAHRAANAPGVEKAVEAEHAGLAHAAGASTTAPSAERGLAPYADERTVEGYAFTSPEASLVLPPFIVSPATVQTQAQAGDDPRMVTITLRSTGDREKDVRRLRCIHGALRSCPGRDRFAFLVFESGKRYLLEFPNETTGVGSELIGKLIKFAGEENIRIDPLKIQ